MSGYPHLHHNMDHFYALPAAGGYGMPNASTYPHMEYIPQSQYGMPNPNTNSYSGMPPMVFPYGAVQGNYHEYRGQSIHPNPAATTAAPFSSVNHMVLPSDGGLAQHLQDLHISPYSKENAYFRGNKPMPSGRPPHMQGRGGEPSAGSRFDRGANQRRSPNNVGNRLQLPKKHKNQKGLEDNVKKTVYISYIDQQVTEEQLASFFADCGKIIDCRICGDPNSAMRFAFIEFTEEEYAQKALSKTGSVLGSCPLRVLPSKTAIVPVSKDLMPRSHDDIERCSRTVYAANIDKKLGRNDVLSFFEQLCGPVNKIRLLGDFQHSTRIAFVEFQKAESAMAALNCSGALLGVLPIRVSPSKTPVRADKEDGDASSE